MMLYIIAVLCAAGSVALFRRYTNRTSLESATRRITAHWLEIRLYFDDPRTVWKAQQHLLLWHWKLLRTCLPALIRTGLLTAACLAILDARYGPPEIQPGEKAVLTTDQPIPEGIVLESGSFYFEADRTMSYKVRANRKSRLHDLELPRDRAWIWPFTWTYTLTTCALLLLI